LSGFKDMLNCHIIIDSCIMPAMKLEKKKDCPGGAAFFWIVGSVL